MKVYTKKQKRFISVLLCLSIITSVITMSLGSVYAAIAEDSISYSFTGSDADTAGYAEGTVTLASAEGGIYSLYWADKNEKPLDGYYEITSMTLSENERGSFQFGYHTAIPADAEKIIAVKSDTSSEISAVYTLPDSKKLPYSSDETLYTFNSYSDIHIDQDYFYKNAEKNWASALEFAANKNTDFIVTSGDSITNASSPKLEWDTYEKILADSSYNNPVYESNGNHDLRTGVASGTKAYVKASGTDNTIENYDANKPYYSIREKTTGDLFIFMALEYVYNPSSEDEFSNEQLAWAEKLLEENYGKGNNIYIVEHSHIQNYGAGDDPVNPYYKAGLSTQFLSTVKFKSLLQKYPDIIWMSGHTHEDFNMGYNYSNENGTACNMIHNPSVAGPTHPSADSHSLDYTFYDGLSQGYYVAVYEDSVIFYGANVCDEKIYPAYSYIMNGSRQSDEDSTNPTDPIETTPPTAATGSTLGEDVETTTYYFVNTQKWEFVNCYAWSDSDQNTCIWPGYACTYFATDEYGNDIYYVKVPSSLDKIIFNNAGNGKQTVDIELDGTNNCFTPDGTTTSDKFNVTPSVWDGAEPTDPVVTDPPETEPTIETTDPIETTTPVTEPIETTAPATDPIETTTPVTEPTEESTPPVTNPTETLPPEPIKMGDIDGDKEITIKDVTCIQMHLADYMTFDETQEKAADVDADNYITIKDATCIQFYLADFIDVFPAEENTNKEDTVQVKLYNAYLLSGLQSYSINDSLTNAKEVLKNYYQFSSYDQYQAVKKLYYTYLSLTDKSEDTDISMSAQLDAAITDLKEIADYIIKKDMGNGYDKDLVLYFAVPDSWLESEYTVKANVCFDSADNSWGQHNMIQTTDNYNGLTVFRYTYSYMSFVSDSIDTLQFQAYEGSNWKTQYVAVSTRTKCDSINGMLYDSATSKWVTYTPAEGTTDVVEPLPDADYALCFYSDSHSWDAIDTLFTKQSGGTYTLDYTVPATGNISLNVYKIADRTYNCVSASTSFDIIASTANSETFTLSSSTSRGKSITLYGAIKDMVISFIYDSVANTLTISYDLTGAEPEPKKSDYVLCYYTSSHTWSEMDTYFVQKSDSIHTLSYTAVSEENISLNVYNTADKTYNCVADSSSLILVKGTADSETFELSASSSRGKSITLYGLSERTVIDFVYDSSANTLTISYDLTGVAPEPKKSDYVLCHYTSSHAWSEIDTYFIEESDTLHTLTYTAVSDDSISLNVYNTSDKSYNCVGDSTSVTITEDTEYSNTFELTPSSSRGKSITVKGLKEGMKLKFIYHSDTNTLEIIYNIS